MASFAPVQLDKVFGIHSIAVIREFQASFRLALGSHNIESKHICCFVSYFVFLGIPTRSSWLFFKHCIFNAVKDNQRKVSGGRCMPRKADARLEGRILDAPLSHVEQAGEML